MTTTKGNKHSGTTKRDDAQRALSLEALQRVAVALEQGAHELAAGLHRARGTRDIPTHVLPVTAEVVTVAAPDTKSKLYKDVDAALCDKPHTFRDLCVLLGVQPEAENSLKSVLVRLQRDGRPVVNLGNGARAIWWIDEHDRIGAIAAGKSRVTSAKR